MHTLNQYPPQKPVYWERLDPQTHLKKIFLRERERAWLAKEVKELLRGTDSGSGTRLTVSTK